LALADRDEIFSYLEQRSPKAAIRIDDLIVSAVRRLTKFPEIGRPGRVEGTRELVVVGTPYIAAYAVLPDRVRVLRVLHGGQMWPDELSD